MDYSKKKEVDKDLQDLNKALSVVTEYRTKIPFHLRNKRKKKLTRKKRKLIKIRLRNSANERMLLLTGRDFRSLNKKFRKEVEAIMYEQELLSLGLKKIPFLPFIMTPDTYNSATLFKGENNFKMMRYFDFQISNPNKPIVFKDLDNSVL